MGCGQPFISGAILKTVNMPEDATIEDVENLHMDAWRLASSRGDLSRQLQVGQPLNGEEGRRRVIVLGDGDRFGRGRTVLQDCEARDRLELARVKDRTSSLSHSRAPRTSPVSRHL